MSTEIVPYRKNSASRSRVRNSASRSRSKSRSASRSRSYKKRTNTKVSVTRKFKVLRKYNALLELSKNSKIPDGVIIYKGKSSPMAEFPINLSYTPRNSDKVFYVKGYKFSFSITRIAVCPVDKNNKQVYLSAPFSIGTYYYIYCKHLVTCKVHPVTEKAMNLKY